MSNAYPNSLNSYTTGTNAPTFSAMGHCDEHNALEAKLGTGASTPTNNTVLRGNGTGSTAYGQVGLTTDVTGTLPVANGGTGVTSSTGTGATVRATSPTITTPTLSVPVISDFTSATHTHANTANGGTLTVSDGSITSRMAALTCGQIKASVSDATSNSNTHVDVTNATLTIVPAVASYLIVNAVFDFRIANAGDTAVGFIRADSSDQTQLAVFIGGAGDAGTVSQTAVIALSVASHTIKLTFCRNTGAGTVTCTTNSGFSYLLVSQ